MEQSRETHIPTVPARPQPQTWFPFTHEHQGGSSNFGAPSCQRPCPAVSLNEMDITPSTVKRLKIRRDFLFVAKGRKAVRAGVVIQTRRRDGSLHCGAGFTATKKVGNAVIRNRAKRRLREAARLLLPLHGRPGYDYVFIARAATPDLEWRLLFDDVKKAMVSLIPSGDTSSTATQA